MKTIKYRLRQFLANSICRSKKVAYLYRQYLGWRVSFGKKWSQMDYLDKHDLIKEFCEKRFPNRPDVTNRIQSTDEFRFVINLLPKFLTGLYPWSLDVCKSENFAWWKNINLALGKLGYLVIRWERDNSQFVAINLWLENFLPEQRKRTESFFEFTHELLRIPGNKDWKVSAWWYAASDLSRQIKGRAHHETVYRSFGKLFHFPAKMSKLSGWLGTDLTAEQKTDILYKYSSQTGKWPNIHLVSTDEYESELYLDAISGTDRRFARLKNELRRCTDCYHWFIPIRDDFMGQYVNWLQCEACDYGYYENEDQELMQDAA